MTKLLNSLNENKSGIAIMIAASACTALGQLCWKLSAGEINLFLIGGLSLYFLGAVGMVIAFRFGSLSVLHPLLSLGYVFALFLGSMFLEEIITSKNYIGTALIIIGAVLIGGGDD
ncbi:EamA/RhaT family transporter [Sediminibacillus dalangtanensis]|uniref:EamA/RhaT family transporter n=1 Tax=Sediminibacillus dalangtanensis TaxID=2729421 RepID=A0ABX7VV30_9BACI|nr:EamA/RhaT family transporter [Sediminibacillus dalangtanensis]QTN00823.1 EamA/RhaT family transporter [Sediminibacillus dalangtanensis]